MVPTSHIQSQYTQELIILPECSWSVGGNPPKLEENPMQMVTLKLHHGHHEGVPDGCRTLAHIIWNERAEMRAQSWRPHPDTVASAY